MPKPKTIEQQALSIALKVSAHYERRYGLHPGDLSGAAFKLSRRAAHLLQGCWKVPRKGNCGCHSLFVMSKRLGLAVSKAGMVGHRIPMTAWPDGPAQFDAEVKIS